MRTALAILAGLALASSCAVLKETVMPPAALTLHVAPDGSDDNPGTAAKPFATLERARDQIRALKKAGKLPRGQVVVVVRGGTYELSRPLELTEDDSGTADSPIAYRAEEGKEVRLSGGRPVNNWRPVTDKAILQRLDPAARGKVFQADLKALGITNYGSPRGGGLELFFNDQPMTLAR